MKYTSGAQAGSLGLAVALAQQLVATMQVTPNPIPEIRKRRDENEKRGKE